MALPDPEMYDDWRAWAKARNQQDALQARREDNWIAEYQPITDLASSWTGSTMNPPSYCLLKNGFVALSGTLLSDTHALFGTIFTLPKPAHILHGHDLGSGPYILFEVSSIVATAATRLWCPIFATGVFMGIFSLSSQACVLTLDGICYRGAMMR